MTERRVERRLAAVLAADVAGYSRLMGNDEEGTLAALKACRRELIDPKINENRGRIVKTTGDGVLVEFASAVDAVRCASEIQRAMAERNAPIPDEQRMEFRIGINVGDIIIDHGDIYGEGVNIAARLETLARPGSICLSDSAYQHIKGKLVLDVADMGEQRLKNIEGPVRVHSIHSGEVAGRHVLPLPDKPSIAVLPFDNMSNDADQQYFADGITEDIITALSKWRWLFVIARNSSFTYKGRAVDVKQVGRELGVRYILEGSVRKLGNRLRLNAQLIDATGSTHVWAERFDRDVMDVFTIQDDLTRHVAAAIGPAISRIETEQAKRKTTEQLVAWDHYLRGMWHLHQFTQTDLEKSLTSFERTLALDPSLAEAHAGIARALLAGTMYHGSERKVSLSRVTAAAKKSLAIDDQNVEAYYALAIAASHSDELDAAFDFGQRATRLNENFAPGYFALAVASLYIGRPQESLEAIDQALRLNPTDPQRFTWLSLRASALYLLNRYEDAAVSAKQSLGLNRYHTALRVLAAANAQLGLMGEANSTMGELLAFNYGDKTISAVVGPFRRATDRASYAEGLSKAGMPI
jgi:adenylate cyclase